MNRAEKRRQQKLAKKSVSNQSIAQRQAQNQQALHLAVEHHNAGRLSQAKSLYQQVLQSEPNHPDALYLLGLIAQQTGNNAVAVDLIAKALTIQPNNADAHNILGTALKAIGELDKAAESYQRAIEIRPQFVEAHYNLGNTQAKRGNRQEAASCYRTAIEIRPDLIQAHTNLGNVLLELGRANEALASFQSTVSIAPEYMEGYKNIMLALKHLGKYDDAVVVLQNAYEQHPEQSLLTDYLADLLNYHVPPASSRDTVHVKAQEALLEHTAKDEDAPDLTDHGVAQLYRECHAIVQTHGLHNHSSQSQIWRGKINEQGCDRHMMIFNTFNVIPEHCFGCYKVAIDPRTVVELFKLLIVFDKLNLKNDNSRKCLVELRPEISGSYKGLIYCRGLDEANEIAKVVKDIIGAEISPDIPVSVKRGCSEFPIAYPDYGRISEDGPAMMAYNEEWREHEDHADQTLIGHHYPPPFKTHNHAGVSLRDVLVMRTWLAYAAAIGDSSYLQVSQDPVEKLHMEDRPRRP